MKQFIKQVFCSAFSFRMGKPFFPVFLNHGILPSPGPLFSEGFDYVTPETFYENIAFLKQHYDIVPLYDFIEGVMSGEQKDISGKCSLTFDDGYACLKEYGFSILRELDVPATIFIISSLIDDKQSYWRDQLRFLKLTGKLNNFLEFCEKKQYFTKIESCSKQLIKITKQDASVSSHLFQEALVAYFCEENLSLPLRDLTGCAYFFLTRDDLLFAPSNIHFGNHTYTHPFMPSLTLDEQVEEIRKCQENLKQLPQYRPIFCLPFGAGNHLTAQAAKRCGYDITVRHSNGLNTENILKEGFVDRITMLNNHTDFKYNLMKRSF